MEVASNFPARHLTQSQHTDTGPTSRSTDPVASGGGVVSRVKVVQSLAMGIDPRVSNSRGGSLTTKPPGSGQPTGAVSKPVDRLTLHVEHHTTPHHTTPHHTTPHYTTPHHTTPHYTTSRHATPHHTTSHHTTSHHTIPHHSTSHHTTCAGLSCKVCSACSALLRHILKKIRVKLLMTLCPPVEKNRRHLNLKNTTEQVYAQALK